MRLQVVARGRFGDVELFGEGQRINVFLGPDAGKVGDWYKLVKTDPPHPLPPPPPTLPPPTPKSPKKVKK